MIPEAWGYIEPDTVPCPCYGDIETCDLCQGTGSVNPHGPTSVEGVLRVLVIEARYNAGVPLWHPEDTFNPSTVGGPGLDVLLSRGLSGDSRDSQKSDDPADHNPDGYVECDPSFEDDFYFEEE